MDFKDWLEQVKKEAHKETWFEKIVNILRTKIRGRA